MHLQKILPTKTPTPADLLRSAEIRFFLICYDIARLTNPLNVNNVLNFMDFLSTVDLTSGTDYAKLKILAESIFLEQTNIQPNRIELVNFCLIHKFGPNRLSKYLNITRLDFDKIADQILKNNENFYQPTHLQQQMYTELKKFFDVIKKLQAIGLEKYL